MKPNTPNKLSPNESVSKSIFLFRNIVNPKRDWSILVILFIVLIVVSVGFDFYMYRKIVNGDMYINVNREDLIIENLKSNELQKILGNFETKRTKITTLKLENLIDPSI